MTPEPKDHVMRASLPWRPVEELTECGRPAGNFDPRYVLSRADAVARFRQQGHRRSFELFCMTCLDTVNRWPTWEKDPARTLSRHLGGYGRGRDDRIDDELRALAELVDRHRDEFDALLTAEGDLVRLSAVRNRRRA